MDQCCIDKAALNKLISCSIAANYVISLDSEFALCRTEKMNKWWHSSGIVFQTLGELSFVRGMAAWPAWLLTNCNEIIDR